MYLILKKSKIHNYQDFSREISEQRQHRFIIFSRFRGLALLVISKKNLEEIYADCFETASTQIQPTSEKLNWLTEKNSASFLYFQWSIYTNNYKKIPVLVVLHFEKTG